jgi:hypothetical protein
MEPEVALPCLKEPATGPYLAASATQVKKETNLYVPYP